MAAKEKKSAITKHLNKDSQLDKSTESSKLRRGRKPTASILNDNKSNKAKSPVSKKRKEQPQDGRTTPNLRKKRSVADVEEESEPGKTPPQSTVKSKKTFLEKELEDILENATGRNTPSTPRSRKTNEKDEDSVESDKLARQTRKGGSDGSDIMDDKGSFLLSKIKKNDKELDDDNISVRSFSTLLRTRRNLDKDDDDVLSVRSMTLKSKKSDVNNDDSASVASSNITKRVKRKKAVPVVKKKMFGKRGRPKKVTEEAKGKISSDKKPIKKMGDLVDVKDSKKILNKTLRYQNITGVQRRLRSAMLLKKQNLKKTKLPEEKTKASPKSLLVPVKEDPESTESDNVKNDKERLRLDSQGVKPELPGEVINLLTSQEPKKDGKTGYKRKIVKKDGGKTGKYRYGERGNELYFYAEGESTGPGKMSRDKLVNMKIKLAKKLTNESKKRKRVTGIHFETTSSPDDSSVIIVQPRIGPKIKYSRLKKILVNKLGGKANAKEPVPKSVLPLVSSANVQNFNQIGSSYIVQSIPNFKLLATNSKFIRSYNANAAVNPNFDASKLVGPNNLPYVEDPDRALATFGPKMSPNDIIVTPSGIVLSNSRLVSTNQHSSSICINGQNAAFLSDASNGNVLYSAQKSVGTVSTTELFYQNSANIIQPQTCTNTTTTILVERPESMPTSLISATSGTVVIPMTSNGGVKRSEMGRLKGYSASTQTDTIASEKASESEAHPSDSAAVLQRLKNNPVVECLPMIPVAKNVNELLMLKSKAESGVKDKTDVNGISKVRSLQKGRDSLTKPDTKRKKRTLRNVRQNHTSVSELTFSEPENSTCEAVEKSLFKTISYEQLNRSPRPEEVDTKVLLQLGSEPMAISESIEPFETASAFLLDNSDKMERKLQFDFTKTKAVSPKIKGAIDVCRFSKENAEALKELGLDSDLDQAKSEMDLDLSPKKFDSDSEMKGESTEYLKKEKMKEEVDNVLKEMPNRKIPNLLRKSDCFNLSKNKIELKNPLVLKNNDYLTKLPSTPPTVIDKLLERNKSLKAEQESKYESIVRNMSENMDDYDKSDVRHKRTLREVRSRKYPKGEQRRLVASKRFVSTNSGCKVFERRGSNPELYSGNYVTVERDVSNENVPLRRAVELCEHRDKYQRRGSIDFDMIQKVMERRCSLPVTADKSEDAKRIKTENVKTILIRSSAPLTSKNQGGEQQTKVINIVTKDDGSKKGQNLMEEIGMEIEKDAMNSAYVNGDKDGRRTSMESSNSETESLKKLMDGITVTKKAGKSVKEVPYSDEKNSFRVEKMRLSIERKSPSDKKDRKGALIEESPEDVVTKETILSALGLQRAAAAQNAQKKDSSGSYQSDGGNYTGTLKTVIKIQRQEKKGNSKNPMKMTYKASSSSSSVSGQTEEQALEQDVDTASKEDTEEETKNGNGKAKSLVIPEKASSFSIHPDRLCSDVCTYCFGKFGLLDTPCHIAQLKDAGRRRNVLAAETQLLADSCLCDACFRHVDKKSNCPTFTGKKIDKRKFSGRKSVCCARKCNAVSEHNVRRKWFTKLKKSIGRRIVLDQAKLEKLQSAYFVTLCREHFSWVDHFMSCGICKKRLTSCTMNRVGSDVIELNAALSADGIPTMLTDKQFLCKICHCYATIRMKCKDPSEMSNSQCQFYETYRKRILQFYEIDMPDSEGEPESRSVLKKKTRRAAKPTATATNGGSKSGNETEVSMEELDKGTECDKDSDMKEVTHMNIPPKASGNLDFGGVSITPSSTEVNPTQIHVKLGNLNIGALGNLNIGQDVRHGTRPGDMQCFPTEAELALRAHFDLQPSAEDESAKAARNGFEKCTTTIQFSPETKSLFYGLQMPYGNHSSFFRHLILLEKYFRNGDLVISRNADPKAVNYISSVQNRIRSYEGIHNTSPIKKPLDISPSLTILPQPVKTEARNLKEIQPSVIQSRPFTLTPMPSNPSQGIPKNSPLSHIQAAVRNIPSPGCLAGTATLAQASMSKLRPIHPKPEISITSVPPDPPPGGVRIGKGGSQAPAALTSKIHENLRNLASKSHHAAAAAAAAKPAAQARAVMLNRTIGGQKQSLVQVTTGGKTIHLTLYQFRRIQQMQMQKKQYLEQQTRTFKMKEETAVKPAATALPVDDISNFDLKNLSPELEIQEINANPNGNEVFPLISEVRSLAGDESSWEKSADDSQTSESFPKIPKALSVSVTKVPPSDTPAKEQSVDPVE